MSIRTDDLGFVFMKPTNKKKKSWNMYMRLPILGIIWVMKS